MTVVEDIQELISSKYTWLQAKELIDEHIDTNLAEAIIVIIGTNIDFMEWYNTERVKPDFNLINS